MKMLSIMKLFAESREVFEQNHRLFVALPNLEGEIKLVLNLIQQYYEAYSEHKYIGSAELKNFYDLQYPNSKHQELYHDLIDNMVAMEVSTDITTDLMEQGIEMAYAQQVVTSLVPVMKGDKFGVLSAVKEDIDAFHAHLRHPPKPTNLLDSSLLSPIELIQAEAHPEGPPWSVNTLNLTIGPARLGTLGCIFGYVNSGKSSFALHNIKEFAKYYKDSSDMICFAGNEEANKRVHARLLSATLGMNLSELMQYEGDINADASALGFNRVKVFGQVKHMNQIRKILDDWGPRVLVIDRGDKVMHDVKCKEVDTVMVRYNIYRDLGVEYNCAIITVEQGVGESSNRQWLNMSDIHNSRVGLQGELDYAIGIGQVLDKKGREDMRYFHVSKNKWGGNEKWAMVFDYKRCVWTPV